MNSVFSQTFANYEYIIIDGSSTDGSFDLIKSSANKIDYWVSEKDTGIYNAMNKGVNLSTGEYLLFLNSGDFLVSPDVLSDSERFLSGEDIIYFDLCIQENNKTWVKSYPGVLSLEYFTTDTLPHPASFIRKDILTATKRFREDLRIVSDWAFFVDAIFLLDAKYKHVNSVLSNFNLDGVSSLSSNIDFIKEEKRKHFSSINHLLFLKKHNSILFILMLKLHYLWLRH